MVGVLIVTHKDLAEALLTVYHLILGRHEGVQALSLDPDAPPETLVQQIQNSIAQLNNGEGVLILTDMLGGTPSNLSLSFLQAGKVEVVTGVNLPMLMKLAGLQQDRPLAEIASALKEFGQAGITVASEVLSKK
jgi:PTS system mannose-specific IIA component